MRWQFEAIGTYWQIDLPGKLFSSQIDLFKELILKKIESFDLRYSRFRVDSWVKKMEKLSGKFELADEDFILFDIYRKLYWISGGSFTPLIAKVLVQAGYDEKYSLKAGNIDSLSSWEDVMEMDFDRQIFLSKPTLFDFGACGKGYLIDLIGSIFEDNGVGSYCIDAGGDIRHRDSRNNLIKVGLENPTNIEQAIGVVEIGNKSICSSALNRRSWGEYSHIIDPFSLRSPRGILGTWVIADETLVADALATALFLVKSDKLVDNFDFEYAILYSDYKVEFSKGFGGEFFIG